MYFSSYLCSHLPLIKIHGIPHFLIGIICGSIWGSFAVRDHLRSWDHLRTRTARRSVKTIDILTMCHFSEFQNILGSNYVRIGLPIYVKFSLGK